MSLYAAQNTSQKFHRWGKRGNAIGTLDCTSFESKDLEGKARLHVPLLMTHICVFDARGGFVQMLPGHWGVQGHLHLKLALALAFKTLCFYYFIMVTKAQKRYKIKYEILLYKMQWRGIFLSVDFYIRGAVDKENVKYLFFTYPVFLWITEGFWIKTMCPDYPRNLFATRLHDCKIVNTSYLLFCSKPRW